MGVGNKPGKSQAELVYAACRATKACDGTISDPVARVIAADWHGGQASRLYSLMSCGAIDRVGVLMELNRELLGRAEDSDEYLVLSSLKRYVEQVGERAKVEGWSNLWVS